MSTPSPIAIPPWQAIDDLDPVIPSERLPSEDVCTRAFWDLKPLADQIPAESIQIARAEARLAYVNAMAGFSKIEPYIVTARSMPSLDVDAILRVPQAARAFLGATRRLHVLVVVSNQLPEKLFHGRRMRKALLSIAEAGVALGAIPEEPVAHIRKGTGMYDVAEDLMELTMLLRDREPALRDKLVIAPSVLEEAAELGAWLQDAINPSKAPLQPNTKPPEVKQASEDRHRMWTLLAVGYAELERLAAYFGVDVPSLQSRRAMKKKATPADDVQQSD